MTTATALRATTPVEPSRPKLGDRVNAEVRMENGKTYFEQITLPDGSMIVTPEQIARFGGGDLNKGRQELRRLIAVESDRTIAQGPSQRPKNVRWATPDDMENIFKLVMADLAENAQLVAPIDEVKVLRTIKLSIVGEGGFKGWSCVIDGPQGKPVAIGLIIPAQWWWSNQWFWQEVVNYVHPDHRKSHHLADLIEFERWAADRFSKNFGYRTFMFFGVLGWKRVRSKIMLYRRKLSMNGACFLYPAPFDDGAK